VYLNLVGIWCRDIGAAAVAATMAGMTVLAVRYPIVGTILAVTGLPYTGFTRVGSRSQEIDRQIAFTRYYVVW